jgi:hypothetical protein
MLPAMRSILDALWRAALYCLHPRVIALSLLPIVLAGGAAFVLGYLYWEPAVNGVRDLLDQWELATPALEWANRVSGGMFRTVIGPLVVTVLSVPVLLIVSLLLVSFMMGPALIDLVAQRRFAKLERRRGAGWLHSAVRSLAVTLATLVLLIVSLPLWLIPPLALVLPPLLWGWLTYRIMAFDAIAGHADAAERRALMKRHRWSLFGIGAVAGYLGAVPSMALIAFGTLTLPLAPVALPLFVWLYTLVFAFTLLWFSHFGLSALARLRAEGPALPPPPPREPAFEVEDVVPRRAGEPAAAAGGEPGRSLQAPAAPSAPPSSPPPAWPPALPGTPLPDEGPPRTDR